MSRNAPPVAVATAPQQARANAGGVSALLYACQQGDVDRVRRILRAQSNALLERDRTRKTALHYCCTSDHIAAAQAADLLVMAAPDLVESRDDDGFTPLHLAVIAGNMPLVTFLLANNADVNAVDNEQHTVVHWATVCGETVALRAVMAAGAPVSTPDVHGGFPLHYAAQMCGGEKDSSLGLQVLHTLLTHPDISVTVEDGEGRQPLLWAASAGSAKAVLALIRAGATVEAHDKDGLTALHCAASRGHTDCIDTLLTLCGASPDVIDSNGCTALHYAVTLGHADATALLLAHGADPNRQDRKGRSPAHCGCAKGQFETVKMLGAQAANLWLRNARGDLPLHEAAASGRRDLVRWLLEARPSHVNARNNDGRCPLHLAALNDNADMCKILLDAGAQVNPVLRTSKNLFMTPLDCAMQRGFRTTAKYLQLHGGVPATRLTSGMPQVTVGSAVSLHIRDDVTLWGGSSSESEKDEAEGKPKSKKKYKRKLSYKYERRKGPVSASEVESEKFEASREERSVKHEKGLGGEFPFAGSNLNNLPTGEGIFIYANEVNINDKFRGVTVRQGDNEVKVAKAAETQTTAAQTQTKSSASSSNEKVDKRPKSAKYGRLKSKSGQMSRSDSDKKLAENESNKQPSPNVPEDKSEASKNDAKKSETKQKVEVEATTKSEEVSNKIEEVSKKIEEVSKKTEEVSSKKIEVKPQRTKPEMPRSTERPRIVHTDQQSARSNTSYEEEDHREIVVEAAVHSPPRETVKDQKTEAEAEDQTEIRLEVPEAPERRSTPIGSEAERGEEEKEAVPEPKDIASERIKEAEEEEKITDGSQTEKGAVGDSSKAEDSSAGDAKIGGDSKVEAGAPEETKKDDIVISTTSDEAVTKEDVKETKDEEMEARGNELSTSQEAKVSPKEAHAKKDEESVQQTGVDASTVQESEVAETIDESKAEIQRQEVAQTDSKIDEAQPKIEEAQEAQQAAVEGATSDATKTEILPPAAQEEAKQPPKEKKAEESPKTESETSTETLDTIREVPQEPSKKHKKDKPPVKSKEEKQKASPDSCIEESGEESPSSSSPSSVMSVARKEHRSFKVLDEEEERAQKVKVRKSSKKSRSHSEGPHEKEHERLKRSKIPTPVSFKTPLSKSDRHLERHEKKGMEPRVPSLPNIHDAKEASHKHLRSMSNMSAPLASAYSDGDRETGSEEEIISSATRKKRLRKRSKTRSAKSAGSDYESSNLIDSGFEPSPRSTRIPKWRHMTDRGVNMSSVTQTIQTNIRRYHLERKIFQHLLELKRLQIRAGQHNEPVLVKRAIDAYHRSCAATVGAGRYSSQDFTFKSFENFLYTSLRKIQRAGAQSLQGLPENPRNPLFCTQRTHRCDHAIHAYTGVPCAAYLPKMDHHTIPKIGFDCKPSGFLPRIDPKNTVTLELCHGSDKQVISLPAERLDQNKRYYVTFTVKGTPNSGEDVNANETTVGHRHSKSD